MTRRNVPDQAHFRRENHTCVGAQVVTLAWVRKWSHERHLSWYAPGRPRPVPRPSRRARTPCSARPFALGADSGSSRKTCVTSPQYLMHVKRRASHHRPLLNFDSWTARATRGPPLPSSSRSAGVVRVVPLATQRPVHHNLRLRIASRTSLPHRTPSEWTHRIQSHPKAVAAGRAGVRSGNTRAGPP